MEKVENKLSEESKYTWRLQDMEMMNVVATAIWATRKTEITERNILQVMAMVMEKIDKMRAENGDFFKYRLKFNEDGSISLN